MPFRHAAHQPQTARAEVHRHCAFTLVELLIVIVLLGIAGALVIPNMASAHSLRVQAALRTLASDLAFAQADAIAFQRRRAVVFNLTANTYQIVEIPGTAVDLANTLYKADGPGGKYIVNFNDASFDEINHLPTLIFDDVGSPAAAATGDQPGLGGAIRLTGSGQTFEIVVEPYTGRISTRRYVPPAPP